MKTKLEYTPGNPTKESLKQCFEVAYNIAGKFTEKGWEVSIVHGVATGSKESKISGVQYIDAWVEVAFGKSQDQTLTEEEERELIAIGAACRFMKSSYDADPEADVRALKPIKVNLLYYDMASGIFVDVEKFYGKAQIVKAQRYTFAQAFIGQKSFGHKGPWERSFIGRNEDVIRELF